MTDHRSLRCRTLFLNFRHGHSRSARRYYDVVCNQLTELLVQGLLERHRLGRALLNEFGVLDRTGKIACYREILQRCSFAKSHLRQRIPGVLNQLAQRSLFRRIMDVTRDLVTLCKKIGGPAGADRACANTCYPPDGLRVHSLESGTH